MVACAAPVAGQGDAEYGRQQQQPGEERGQAVVGHQRGLAAPMAVCINTSSLMGQAWTRAWPGRLVWSGRERCGIREAGRVTGSSCTPPLPAGVCQASG